MSNVGRKAKQSWMKPEDFAKIREALGLTQAELAAKLDITSTTVSGYELGRVPVPKVLMLLLKAAKAEKITLR